MPTCILVQTEKAYRTQENNTFVLSFLDKGFATNKIELTKFLKSQGLTPLKVTTTNSQQKARRRGRTGRKVTVFRPQKFYVKLKVGEIINDETITKLNEELNKPNNQIVK